MEKTTLREYLHDKEFKEWYSKVRIENSPFLGRYLVANEEIKAGELIFTDYPILTVISQNKLAPLVCHNCFENIVTLEDSEEDFKVEAKKEKEKEKEWTFPLDRKEKKLPFHCGTCSSVFWCSKRSFFSPCFLFNFSYNMNY